MNAIDLLNDAGRPFVSFALPMFVQSSLLILFLFGLESLLRRRVRAVIRHGLWLLVLVKLVLPPSFALPTGVGYWLGSRTGSPSADLPMASGTEAVVIFPELGRPAADGMGLQIPRFKASRPGGETTVFLAWIGGCLVLLGFVVSRQRGFARRTRPHDEPGPELTRLADDCRRVLGISAPVRLAVTRDDCSPAVCGLWRPRILIPRILLDRLTPVQMRGVLLHELAHVRRLDLWVNTAQTLLQILYWWHPLVWLANARIRRLREEAVDEHVMVAMGPGAESYPRTLIEVARAIRGGSRLVPGLMGIVETGVAWKRRVKRLLTRPVPSRASAGPWGVVFILGMAAMALPMAGAQDRPAAAPDAPTRESAGDTMQVELEVKFVEMPQAALDALNLGVPSARQTNGHLNWILDRARMTALIGQLEQQPGVDILAAPRVMVRSGQQAQIEVRQPVAASPGDDRAGPVFRIPSGPAGEILPRIRGDAVEMSIATKLTEAGRLVQKDSGDFEIQKPDAESAGQPAPAKGPVYSVNAVGYIEYQIGTANVTLARDEGVVILNPDVKNSKGRRYCVIVNASLNRLAASEAGLDRAGTVSREPAAHATSGRALEVTLAGERVYVDGLEVEPASLGRRFESLVRETPDTTLVLKADSRSPFTLILEVMDAARAAGIHLLTLREWDVNPAIDSSRKGEGTASSFTTNTFRLSRTGGFLRLLEHGSILSTDPAGLAAGNPSVATGPGAVLRSYFAASGIDMNPPGTVGFNDDGDLTVVCRAGDVDRVKAALDRLSLKSEQQIQLDLKFVKMEADLAGTLGIRWREDGGTPGDKPARSGFLTPSEMAAVTRQIEGRRGFHMLAAPKVTTLSGRAVEILMFDQRKPEDAAPSQGPTMQCVPKVLPDGDGIRLVGLASLVGLPKDAEAVEKLLPDSGVISIQEVVPNGHTLAMLGSEAGQAFLVFLTPTLIDPAGNPIHAAVQRGR